MVDVLQQIRAVTRELKFEERDGQACNVQTLVQEYPAALSEAWAATTTSERIARWFLPISGELAVGGRYQFEGNAGGEVLACTPPADGTAEYRVTWEFGGGVTWVRVRLTELSPELTRFELEHSAVTSDVPAVMWETYGPGATGVGWDGALLGLALHLGALDGAIAPDAAAAWALTDEGKAFYRAAAYSWADAHVSAGGSPEDAKRAADACYGFYTGDTPEA